MNMLYRFVTESTDCDFKVALEIKKPKSWLKTVSAFANGSGGVLVFGIEDGTRALVGLKNAQEDAEAVSRLIKERITPMPRIDLRAEREEGKDILVLTVFPGINTPYYYKADGLREAYIRIGNESMAAPDHELNRLILKGMNLSFDALSTPYEFKNYSFTKLRERYHSWTGRSFDEKLFDSFGLRDEAGKLTNTGALLADDSPIRHSRLFCVHWDGLDKSGGKVDAIDSQEYSGSLITLLNEGVGFIKRNMKLRWKKTADSRVEMPDYVERSFFEALVNALVHRDYLILGSEVHIDMYDDRMTIYSPGGMPDGTLIQNRDLLDVASTRRNPVLADVFARLGYMERQGSGLHKIIEAYQNAANFQEGLEPSFSSSRTEFTVKMQNLNYKKTADSGKKQPIGGEKTADSSKKQPIGGENTADWNNKQAFNNAIKKLKVSVPTINNLTLVFEKYGQEGIFGRSDIGAVCGLTDGPSGRLLRKMKEYGFAVPVSGQGKGKYRFVIPED